VQIDPIKPTLKAAGTKRLKLKYDGPLSHLTFKFNLRRYTWIRPTFLCQTDISSFSLDFNTDSLTLSRRELIPPGAAGVLPMVDLRPLGSPVYHYGRTGYCRTMTPP
jgi:hypothetical protein